MSPHLTIHAVLAEISDAEENEVLFQSTVGNAEISGMVTFREIRPEVTEVQFDLEYSLCSWSDQILDRLTNSVEQYLDAALRGVQACLNGDLPQALLRARLSFRGDPAQWAMN